jgi:hypothetical protein
VNAELSFAARAEAGGDLLGALTHLERAHVLGQLSTAEHVRVHWRMLLWGWRRRSVQECVGQLFRLTGAATKTVFGWVPHGNTGGANVSPFKPMPVAAELQRLIDQARAPLS